MNFNIEEFCAGENLLACENKKSVTRIYVEMGILIAVSLISLVCDGFLIGSEVMSGIINGSKLSLALIFVLAFIIHVIPEGVWAFSIMKRLERKNNCFILTEDRALEINYTNTSIQTREVMLDSVYKFSYRKGVIKFYISEDVEVFCGFSLDKDCVELLAKKFKKS